MTLILLRPPYIVTPSPFRRTSFHEDTTTSFLFWILCKIKKFLSLLTTANIFLHINLGCLHPSGPPNNITYGATQLRTKRTSYQYITEFYIFLSIFYVLHISYRWIKWTQFLYPVNGYFLFLYQYLSPVVFVYSNFPLICVRTRFLFWNSKISQEKIA